jgi:FkbM family methyltransferase
MKQLLKELLGFLHIHLTRNQRYDAHTRAILRKVLKPQSTCVDVGCHKGEILDLMLYWAPEGTLYGFEPIPEFYEQLQEKYRSNGRVRIFATALSDKGGRSTFQHVLNAPAYSGIRKRKYDNRHVDIREITVSTGTLDAILVNSPPVDLIKIDVEGAEYLVLRGARETIRRSRPVIIFEFGMGAADCYGTRPGDIYHLLCTDLGLRLNTLKGFLHDENPLTEETLTHLFEESKEYYFIAYP